MNDRPLALAFRAARAASDSQEIDLPVVTDTVNSDVLVLDEFTEMLDRIEREESNLSNAALKREIDGLLGRPVLSQGGRGASGKVRHAARRRAKPNLFDWLQPIVSASVPLTRTEAATAATAVEAGLFAVERLELIDRWTNRRQETTELEILAREGSLAYELLVLSNVRLVFMWCKGIARSIDQNVVQDAFQAGCMGLMRGIQGWDHQMGFTLSTYVSWHIRQAIQRWRMNEVSLIRLPVHVWEQLDSNSEEMTPETRVAVEQARNLVRLDDIDVNQERGLWLASLDEVIDDPFRHRYVDALLGGLSDREARVLRLRHGATSGTDEPMTLDEIGRIYGVTRERIRQIESQALKKVRETAAEIGVCSESAVDGPYSRMLTGVSVPAGRTCVR